MEMKVVLGKREKNLEEVLLRTNSKKSAAATVHTGRNAWGIQN